AFENSQRRQRHPVREDRRRVCTNRGQQCGRRLAANLYASRAVGVMAIGCRRYRQLLIRTIGPHSDIMPSEGLVGGGRVERTKLLESSMGSADTLSQKSCHMPSR